MLSPIAADAGAGGVEMSEDVFSPDSIFSSSLSERFREDILRTKQEQEARGAEGTYIVCLGTLVPENCSCPCCGGPACANEECAVDKIPSYFSHNEIPVDFFGCSISHHGGTSSSDVTFVA